MRKELIAIAFKAKIKPVKPINEQFTLCKCFVMAIGKNVNKTIISKESVDDALPTLFNIPVVGFLNLYARNNPRTPSRPYHRAPGPGI